MQNSKSICLHGDISQSTAGNFLKFGFVFEIQIAHVIEFVCRIYIDIHITWWMSIIKIFDHKSTI